MNPPAADPYNLPLAPKGKPFVQLSAATWDLLVRCLRAAKLLPGKGVRLHEGPAGTTLHSSGGDGSGELQHPWKVTIAGEHLALVRFGLLRVNGDNIPVNINGSAMALDTQLNQLAIPTDADGKIMIRLYVTDDFTAGTGGGADSLSFAITAAEIIFHSDPPPDNTVGTRYLWLAQIFVASGSADVTPLRWAVIDLLRAIGEESADDLYDNSWVTY